MRLMTDSVQVCPFWVWARSPLTRLVRPDFRGLPGLSACLRLAERRLCLSSCSATVWALRCSVSEDRSLSTDGDDR